MERINLDHWFVKDNKLSISLMRFYVSIDIHHNSRSIYHQLKVIDGNRDSLVFNFYTLEDALAFTENLINKCNTLNEVIAKYEEQFEQNKFKGPRVEQQDDPKKGTITLTAEEVDEAIIGYFGSGKEYRVSSREELSLDFQGNPQINFYLIEHLDYYGINKKNEIMLTKTDIKNALAYYLEDLNCDIIDFKYLGGVHHTGMYIDEDTPHYEGIEVYIKEKEKNYRLVKGCQNEKRS